MPVATASDLIQKTSLSGPHLLGVAATWGTEPVTVVRASTIALQEQNPLSEVIFEELLDEVNTGNGPALQSLCSAACQEIPSLATGLARFARTAFAPLAANLRASLTIVAGSAPVSFQAIDLDDSVRDALRARSMDAQFEEYVHEATHYLFQWGAYRGRATGVPLPVWVAWVSQSHTNGVDLIRQRRAGINRLVKAGDHRKIAKSLGIV